MSDKIVVVLVGPQGAGKSTWCAENLPDFMRISQDEQGPREHIRKFEEAVVRGEPRIVVDRTNGPKFQRKRYLAFARQHGYRTRIVWFNVDRDECLRRCRARTDHPTLTAEKADSAIAIYFRNLQFPTRVEADEIQIVGHLPAYVPVVDLTESIGNRRHLIVGDVHGCFDELRELLDRLHYDASSDVLISVGDIVDRGPKVRETIEFLRRQPNFHTVLGNHEDKLARYVKGNPVKIGHGLQQTIAAFGDGFPPDFLPWLESLPLILKTPSGYVVHAGFDPESSPVEQSREDCIYMRFHGGKTYFDEMNGILWHALWPKDGPRVFFGHIPTEHGPELPHVVALDGGCVFGGELRIFDSTDGRVHRIKAFATYAENDFAKQPVDVSGPDQVKKREEYVAQNLIRSDRTDDGTLAIYTYTDACVYANAWDEITRNSRGHIYNLATGECVAWAFPKFFNLGENPESLPERFAWDQPYEIYEKLDGWLGVLYRHEGRFKIATRGSFHSSGSVWATEEIAKYDLSSLPDEATLCFEILTPEQRIILDYGDTRRLMILGAFNRHTGEEFPRASVEQWATQCDLGIVPVHPPMSLAELKSRQKELQQVEGFVLRFPDGRRVKIKTEWYTDLARLMANLNPITVWESLRNGRVDREYLQKIPEELREIAEGYTHTIETQFEEIRARLEAIVRPILERVGPDRAALGRYSQEHKSELGIATAAIFMMLDNRTEKLEGYIKELIYPRGNQYVDVEKLLPRPAPLFD